MKKNYYLLALTGLLSVSAIGFSSAVAAAAEEKSPWSSSVELGYIRTTGNTENQTLAAKGDVVYEVDKWRHAGHAEGYGQQADDGTGQIVVSAERYELSGQSDFKFSERDYFFALIKLMKDRFSGFEYEDNVSLGYGRKVIKQDNMELDLEIGPGARFFKVDNGKSEDEATLRLAAKYWWTITETSKFTQDLLADIGESFTASQSVTGIQANINETLALKFTYTIRNKDKVPLETKKTDTETAMTLVYTF